MAAARNVLRSATPSLVSKAMMSSVRRGLAARAFSTSSVSLEKGDKGMLHGLTGSDDGDAVRRARKPEPHGQVWPHAG